MADRHEKLDVGEGFPPMPMERFINADKTCAPERRCLLRVALPERVTRSDPADPSGKRKIHKWAYSVHFSFFARTHAAAQAEANRFMLEQLRQEARRSAGIEARAAGRKRQAEAARGNDE